VKQTTGKRRTLVTIEYEHTPEDDRTGAGAVWKELTRAFVAVETKPGVESEHLDQQRVIERHLLSAVWTPKLAQVTADMRIRLKDGRTWNITSARNIENLNREICLECESVA
jgi:SPP1 family predicted phage head-tail adaptor